MLNLPTLKYRRLRDDMIELYKMITNKQDRDVTLKFNTVPVAVTRGNTFKIRQDHVRYDLRKFSFSNKVRTLWNSLPDIAVNAESANSFREDWTDSAMIRKLNLIGKLTLKVSEVEVIYLIYNTTFLACDSVYHML